MLRVVLVTVLMLVLGATAAARTGEHAAQPRTLANVRGSVVALAQAGRRIAWTKTRASCGRRFQILTLPGRRPVDVSWRRGRSCSSPGGGFALSADGRVLWQGLEEEGNTFLTIDLYT